MTEEWEHVTAQVRLDLRGRARPMDLDSSPLLGVLAEGHPACSRVDVRAEEFRVVNAREELLSVEFAGEGL
jgi:hypothetical protein